MHTNRQQKLQPEISSQAKKYLKNLDAKVRNRIIDGINKIPTGDDKPYKSTPGIYRKRIGKHRILYEWISDFQILVILIELRDKSYKKGV